MWDHFSKKLKQHIDKPLYLGILKSPSQNEMRLVTGKAEIKGATLIFYWQVDESDGIIVDASFQLFGPPLLLGLADITCELMMRKSYEQISRLKADLIEKQAAPLTEQDYSYLNLILCAIDEAVQKCLDIPIDEVQTPFALDDDEEFTLPPNWQNLPKAEKISHIENLLNKEVRPYIELDAGGIEIVDLENNELTISYQGACTTCYAATGSTLSAIQQIVRTKIDPAITVVPNL